MLRSPQLILALSVLSAGMLAAQTPRSLGTVHSYTSPDGAFRFAYGDDVVICQRSAKQHDWWEPAESCEAYVPPCSSGGRNIKGVAVCLGLRMGRAQRKTDLEGAGFNVVEPGPAANESACLSLSKPQVPAGNWKPVTINGIQYHTIVSDDVASGQGGDDYVYRQTLGRHH